MKTASKTQQILGMLKGGASANDIAKKLKTSRNYVYYVKWNAAKQNAKKTAKKRKPKKTNVHLQKAVVRDNNPDMLPVELPEENDTALDMQIGGIHYIHMAIQPMEYSMANKLDACQHTAIKYISRFRDKGGLDDLKKAKHVIDMLIHFEQNKVA